jgi:ABC-type sugar transport system ATPase subunit
MALGDRLAVLREGVIQQVASPTEIERRPANTFVAGFIGSPAMNLFAGHLRIEAGTTLLECPWFQLSLDEIKAACPASGIAIKGAAHEVGGGSTSLTPCAAANSPPSTLHSLTHGSAGEILLGVRPYDLHLVDRAQADAVAHVETIERIGNQQVIHAVLPLTLSPGGRRQGQGECQTPIRIMAPAERRFQPNDQVGIRLQRDRLHLFDTVTGRRLN